MTPPSTMSRGFRPEFCIYFRTGSDWTVGASRYWRLNAPMLRSGSGASV
jgi:hypothetical protein